MKTALETAKAVKKALKLTNRPDTFHSRTAAFSWADHSLTHARVLLGENGLYFVASGRDFQKLLKAGYERAL